MIKNTKTLLLFLALTTSIFSSVNAYAEVGVIISAKIVRTLNDTAFGGCMIMLDTAISNATVPGTTDLAGLDCPSAWLSADCNAVYHTQAQSNAMWASALTAFTLQKDVLIYVVDTEKFGNYCAVRRMDVLR
ncbi:MAG: hypothetical protein KTR16_14455 [Acidiferrobacterales bacterium]|nr:hypothetical protein [Acidiferrobacterales bacterium]